MPLIFRLSDKIKSLSQRWLLYGIGTMFSMAVLAFMASIALDMVVRVTGVFWAVEGFGQLIPALASKEGFTSQAMQQGGMGLILTTLILTTLPGPPRSSEGRLLLIVLKMCRRAAMAKSMPRVERWIRDRQVVARRCGDSGANEVSNWGFSQ